MMILLKSNLNRDAEPPGDGELRCCCGRLLAVRVAAGYEIRCSRCKSVQLLPLEPAPGGLDAEDETR